MYEDPMVDEVRKTKERLAEKHNFDVRAIFEDLRKRQATFKRLVQRERKGAAYLLWRGGVWFREFDFHVTLCSFLVNLG